MKVIFYLFLHGSRFLKELFFAVEEFASEHSANCVEVRPMAEQVIGCDREISFVPGICSECSSQNGPQHSRRVFVPQQRRCLSQITAR